MTVTLGFDDLQVGGDGEAPLPEDYSNLNWSGFTVYNRTAYQPPNHHQDGAFDHAVTSGDQAIFCTLGKDLGYAELSSSNGTLELKTLEITAGNATGKCEVIAIALRGGVTSFEQRIDLDSHNPTSVFLGGGGADEILFYSTGKPTAIIFDDLTFKRIKGGTTEGHGAFGAGHDAGLIGLHHQPQVDLPHGWHPIA